MTLICIFQEETLRLLFILNFALDSATHESLFMITTKYAFSGVVGLIVSLRKFYHFSLLGQNQPLT